MSDVWLVTLTTGEYSDTRVQFLRVFGSEADARTATSDATAALAAVVASRDEDWYPDSDDLTPEEAASLLLPADHGKRWFSLAYEPRWEVHRVPASGTFLPADILARQHPKVSVP